jgi:hypothetical protein
MKPVSHLGRAIACVVSAVLLSSSSVVAQGGGYNAREPARCAARNMPAQGAPSAARVAELIKCSVEGIGDGRLYLLDEIRVQTVGQGRPFDAQNDYFDNIDRAHPIYPITGSQIRYACLNVGERNPAGKNCTSFVEANAKGACYRMVGGDWYCSMTDLVQRKTEGVAPPAN